MDLRGVPLRLQPGMLTAVSGAPGSGKSALMRLVSGLAGPSAGELWVGDQNLTQANTATARHPNVGIVYPALSLVPSLDVLANITLSVAITGTDVDKGYLTAVVRSFALEDIQSSMPGELTAKQSQGVAFARAFLLRPTLVVANEPMRSLNPAEADSLLKRVGEAARALNQTVLIATSSRVPAHTADREVTLAEGAITLDWDQSIGKAAIVSAPAQTAEADNDDLPASLDDIAPPPRLSEKQARLVSKAERILEELPGPITLGYDDPFV